MSFADAFADMSKIDTYHSLGYIYDARQLMCQSRSFGDNYLMEDCSKLDAWSVHTGGSANVSIVNIGIGGTANPAGTYCFQLATGAFPNSVCTISRAVPVLPEKYSLWLIVALPAVDADVRDALNIVVQSKADNAVMSLMLYQDHVTVGDYRGQFHLLATHSPVYGCEDWFEVKPTADGRHKIDLYQGCELVGSQELQLPVGPPANGGLVFISQGSSWHSGQISQLLGINIGDTQLPDDALIQSLPYTVGFNASAINVLFKVEDVCNAVRLNVDFTAELAVGSSVVPVTLRDLGVVGTGIIDYTKPVRLFSATVPCNAPQGAQVCYKIHMLNGRMMALLNASFEPVSVY